MMRSLYKRKLHMKDIALGGLLVTSLLLSGCVGNGASVFYPITPGQLKTSSDTKHIVDKNYQLGVRRSVYIGQSVVRVKDYHVQKTSSEPFFVSMGKVHANWILGPSITFQENSSFKIIGTVINEGETYYAVSPPHPTYQSIPMLVHSDGTYSNKAMGRNGLVFTPDSTSVRYSPKNIKFTRLGKE